MALVQLLLHYGGHWLAPLLFARLLAAANWLRFGAVMLAETSLTTTVLPPASPVSDEGVQLMVMLSAVTPLKAPMVGLLAG